jgi:hypothetical protein
MSLADNAYSMVRDLWDWPKVVDDTLKVYESVSLESSRIGAVTS